MMVAFVAVLGGALVVWQLADRMYLKPAAALRKNISDMQGTQARVEDVMESWFGIRRDLKAFGSTQLAGDFDDVEHRLRTSLLTIGASAQLKGVAVSNAGVRPERTPLYGARLRSRLGRALSDARDFGVIKGTITGYGTLDQVMFALATLQSQDWLHRIDRVSVEPRGRERAEFTLDLGFSVAFAPDLAASAESSPTVREADAALVEEARRIASRNVFVPPLPPPPEPPPPVVAPPPVVVPPPPPPYDRWKVTGVLERRASGSTASVEVWVLQLDTGEQRVLVPGDEVLGHVLEWGEEESAIFVFEGNRYEILQGQTLSQRTRLN
jgi:hypothetical protein